MEKGKLLNYHVEFYDGESEKKQSKLINENKTTVEIMKKIQLLGKKSCDILEKGKIDDYGLTLDEHWRLKKKLEVL